MLDNFLEITDTRISIPRREAKPFYKSELKDAGKTKSQRVSFEVDHKYILELKLGVTFVSNSVELERKEKSARMRLSHLIYKEAIDGLYEIIGTSSEPEVQEIAAKMIDEMRGEL